jgi:hypothetical protein
MPNSAVPVSSVLEQFRVMCSNAASRLGLQHVIVIARDPGTGAQSFIASPGSKDALREFAAGKFGLSEDVAETGWPSD